MKGNENLRIYNDKYEENIIFKKREIYGNTSTHLKRNVVQPFSQSSARVAGDYITYAHRSCTQPSSTKQQAESGGGCSTQTPSWRSAINNSHVSPRLRDTCADFQALRSTQAGRCGLRMNMFAKREEEEGKDRNNKKKAGKEGFCFPCLHVIVKSAEIVRRPQVILR